MSFVLILFKTNKTHFSRRKIKVSKKNDCFYWVHFCILQHNLHKIQIILKLSKWTLIYYLGLNFTLFFKFESKIALYTSILRASIIGIIKPINVGLCGKESLAYQLSMEYLVQNTILVAETPIRKPVRTWTLTNCNGR
jgi:hypothetical protein